MILRRTLQCTSCGSKVITRTQIGHKKFQEHAFACPNCGVLITFALDLDQEKASGTIREPQNAQWTVGEDSAIGTLAFSDEIPVPADLDHVLSPFLATFWNFKNWQEYDIDEGERTIWVRFGWPSCERCMVHFEREDWDLFDKEFPPGDGQPLDTTNRLIRLNKRISQGFSKFTLNPPQRHQRITQRLALAANISASLCSRLAREYLAAGKIADLWNQIGNVRRSYVTNYSALQPLVQIRYWHEDSQDLDTYRLPDKRFDALRHVYIDCYETLCRLLVIAVGIEIIIHHRSLDIPTKKGTMTLEDFERLPNGNKPDIIKRYPMQDLFLPFMDSTLRNGIGHHSAHYDAKTDELVLRQTKASGTTTVRIPYIVFCSNVINLFAAFELGAMYHHALHLKVAGRLS